MNSTMLSMLKRQSYHVVDVEATQVPCCHDTTPGMAQEPARVARLEEPDACPRGRGAPSFSEDVIFIIIWSMQE